MSEWVEKRLGDILQPKGYIRGPFGSALKRGEMKESGIPVYEQKNAIYDSREFRFFIDEKKFQELQRFQVQTNDLIISCSGTVGRISIIKEDDPKGIISQALLTLRPDTKKVALKFLYYFFNSRDGFYQLTQASHGSVQVNIAARKVVEQIPIFLPPLPEQEAIATVLSSLDDKIDLLQRQNQTLEALAQTLFRQWFIEEPNVEWQEKPLDEIAEYFNGLACQKYPPENDVDKLPVLKIKELRNGISEQSDWATSKVSEEYIVENGDVIFSWSGSLMVKIWDGGKCVLNQHLFKVTSTEYPKWFYYFWTIHHLEKFIAIAESKATTMGHIKRGDLSSSLIYIPSKQELNEMNQVISPLIDKIILNNRQISKLSIIRDTLLPKLMSGDVRVRM